MKIILSLVLLGFLGISSGFADEGNQGSILPKKEFVNEKYIGLCPVMREPASKEFSYNYEGKTYYFCGFRCIDKFKNSPQRYISRIKEISVEMFKYGFSPQTIKVKNGDLVKLTLTSRDVPHRFYIKEYGINVAVEKGKVERLDFVAREKGDFDVTCPIYSNMKGKFIVRKYLIKGFGR